MDISMLRPIERRMRRMSEAGIDEVEIAWRFRRSPRYVRRVLDLSEHAGRSPHSSTDARGLRPLERRVLHLREQGADFNEMAPRFRRRPRSLAQVEQLATYKLQGA